MSKPFIKGDNPVFKFRSKQFAAITLPLILGGCGLPVAFSVASFVADGVSFVATDKTLTDHGLSIITDKDCAVWRAIKGEDICSESADSDSPVMIASNQDIENLPESALSAVDETSIITASNMTPHSIEPLIRPQTNWTPTPPTTVTAVTKLHLEPAPDRPIRQIVKITPQPSSSGDARTFFIIASYHKLKDAERFAKNQTRPGTQILSGKAKGKSVFRVAIGPVSSPNRRSTKQGLIKSGYHDVWALKLKKPKIIVEVASLQ